MATISDVIKQLNDQHHWTLPTVEDFPPGSQLREIWSLEALPPEQPSNSVLAVSRPYALAPSLSARFVVSVAPDPPTPQAPPRKQGAASWQSRRSGPSRSSVVSKRRK